MVYKAMIEIKGHTWIDVEADSQEEALKIADKVAESKGTPVEDIVNLEHTHTVRELWDEEMDEMLWHCY